MNLQGFTLIEIIIVIVIIGLMSAIAIPNLRGPTASYERKAFIEKFNSLLFLGWQQALITHKLVEIKCDILDKTISMVGVESIDASGKPTEKELKGLYRSTTIPIPDQFEVKNSILKGMMKCPERRRAQFWFFIMPDGLAQDVIINLTDTKDHFTKWRSATCWIRIKPFYGAAKRV